MKRLLLSAAVLTAIAVPAHAQHTNWSPYVGFDLQHHRANYKNDNIAGFVFNTSDYFEDRLNGFNVHVGNRFTPNFGLELGYYRTEEGSKNINLNLAPLTGVAGDVFSGTKIRLHGITLDAMGYFPVAQQLDLIGTAGISWNSADIKYSGTLLGVTQTLNEDENEFGLRLGGGAEFHFTDNVSLRGLARWQQADFDDSVDNIWTYSVGLNFSF